MKKIVRIVTESNVVKWHLEKFLDNDTKYFAVYVIGDGVEFYKDNYPHVNFINIKIKPKINIISDLVALIKINKTLKLIKPDIVHSLMPKAGLLSAISANYNNVPLRIHTFTGQIWMHKKGIKRLFYKALDMFVIKLNTICIADSPSQSEFLFKEGIKDNGKPLKIISKGSLIGVDFNKFNINKKNEWRYENRRALNIDDKNFVIGFLARKTIDKGALLMLQAFKKISPSYQNIKLIYAGPDYSNGILSSYIDKNNDYFNNMIEIGIVDKPEILISTMDILCMPSYREGFGSIIIDAAALKVPCIGSNIYGIQDAIDNNKSGILFEIGDVDDLINKILICYQNKALIQYLGQNAYSRAVADFDSKEIYQNLYQLYSKYLEN